MRRYNYAPSPFSVALVAAAERLTLPALRAPAAIVASALTAVGVTVGIEIERIAALERAAIVIHERAAETAADAARLTASDADLSRMRRIEAAIDDAHRTAIAGLNELVLLGNRLPAQTWLTRIHADRVGTWAIDGRSVRIPEVGATLAGLQRLQPVARVRLLSLTGPADRTHAVRFSLAWERTSP